jgi:polyisoprenoid-binding protein YceI
MKIITLIIGLIISSASFSQTLFMTRSGQISFFSKTQVENIDAVNNEATSIMNIKTGEVAFAVLVKSFRFQRALMEEHFNENYMESDKFPKATFSGRILNIEAIDLSKNGSYPIEISGDLTIHGVTQNIKTNGVLTVANTQLSATSTFPIRLENYKIEIPALVSDKIAKEIEIKVNCVYQPKS